MLGNQNLNAKWIKNIMKRVIELYISYKVTFL